MHRLFLQAFDKTLRDILGKDIPFGGKIVILAGDFRQCLPVTPGANRAQIVKTCLPQSFLWQHFVKRSLTVNMRVRASGDLELEAFDKWCLSIGDGKASTPAADGQVKIPDHMCFNITPNTEDNPDAEVHALHDFCQLIFPDLKTNLSNPDWLRGRTILAPTNKQVDAINDMLESWLPGDVTTLTSSDKLEDDYQQAMRVPDEFLNTMCPNGWPRHILRLKPGMPLMLLRNLSPKDGLCNGSKLIYKETINNTLMVCMLGEKTVLIPRIKLLSDSASFNAFNWSRRQFPVRAAFATTINKVFDKFTSLLRPSVPKEPQLASFHKKTS